MKLFGQLFFSFACWLVAINVTAQSDQFRFGIIGKAEFNRLKVENNDGVASQLQPDIKYAAGIYAAKGINHRFFVDASILISSAKYTVNYTQYNAAFFVANIGFTQCNFNLNYILNPTSSKPKCFLYVGGQYLVRRDGTERYIEAVLPNTYWPANRVMAQMGVGVLYSLGKGYMIQPFAGFRINLNKSIIYDAVFNQYYAGIVVTHHSKIGIGKKRYLGCPIRF